MWWHHPPGRRHSQAAGGGLRSFLRLALMATMGAAALVPTTLSSGDPGNLESVLRQEVASARQVSAELGVHILDLETGQTVYGFNADRPRILASNAKLFTSAAALDLLGPGHFFETRIVREGSAENGVLEGRVAVIGGGDPNISGRDYYGDYEHIFRRWAMDLRREGIRSIAGDLILVDGLFDGVTVHPSWPRDQLDRWYEAPVAALAFSDSCVLVRVHPGASPGKPARVETVPDLPVITVQNLARTVSSSRSHWVDVGRGGEGPAVRVRGSVYRKAAPTEKWLAVEDPVAYFGNALEETWAKAGVVVQGQVRRASDLPAGRWELSSLYRSSLLSTLEVVNKRSQNFYAECVVKLLGAVFCGEGSWEKGTQVVEEFLEGKGISDGRIQLADGSGMSRESVASPEQVTELLRHMFHHRWGREFTLTLPHSGEEGLRWEKRLADTPYRGNVFAKTGSLNGVSTLSGYAKALSGKLYAFSILCNGTRGNWGAKKAQDDIVKALVDHG